MPRLAVLLAIPLLSSCALLQAPGRLLQAAGRTFGLGQNDVEMEGGPAANPSAKVALKSVERESRPD